MLLFYGEKKIVKFHFFSVYDQTIPIVAAQLLFTVGVTCALAFELPSEPIYHITQKLRQSLLNVEDVADQTTTPASNDTSSEDDHSRIDKNFNDLNYVNRKQYYDSMNKHSYYYSTNYYGSKYYQQPLSPNYISDKSDNNIFNTLSNQSPIFVTPKPSNQTKNEWTSLVSTWVQINERWIFIIVAIFKLNNFFYKFYILFPLKLYNPQIC